MSDKIKNKSFVIGVLIIRTKCKATIINNQTTLRSETIVFRIIFDDGQLKCAFTALVDD